MKAILTLVTSLVVGAGVVAGYLDHRAARNPPDPSGTDAGSGSDVTSLVDQARQVEEAPASSQAGGRSQGAAQNGPAQNKGADPTSGAGGAEEPPQAPSTPAVNPELERRREEIRDLLSRREFEKAVRSGETLLDEATGSPGQMEEIARLVARARVLARFAEALPDPRDLSGMAEVHLANGNRIHARKIERQGDRYRIQLDRGGSLVPGKEDVLEVRPIDPETQRDREWETLEPRLARLEDPLDLYLDGVERCHELGLEEESFEILERILEMDSEKTDQIPLLFVPDADEALLQDWRVAAGRLRPRLPTRTVVASREPPRERTPPDAGPDPGPQEEPSPAAKLDPAELVRAAQLVEKAQGLYRGAARKEGREGELEEARELLGQALDILETQPAGEDSVRRLRRQVATLLSDVARASPF